MPKQQQVRPNQAKVQHVEQAASQAPHELAFYRWWPLEVYPAYRPTLGIEGDTPRLHSLCRQASPRNSCAQTNRAKNPRSSECGSILAKTAGVRRAPRIARSTPVEEIVELTGGLQTPELLQPGERSELGKLSCVILNPVEYFAQLPCAVSGHSGRRSPAIHDDLVKVVRYSCGCHRWPARPSPHTQENSFATISAISRIR